MKKNTNTTLKPVAGIQFSDEQIKAIVTHFNTKGSIPGNKIVCTATGKLTTCVGPWRTKKIKEYGSLENLLRTYKCRGVNKALRAEKVKAIGTKAKKVKEKEEVIYEIPQMKITERKPLQGQDLIDSLKTACARPDIYLNDNRSCNNCGFCDICLNSLKKVRKLAKV